MSSAIEKATTALTPGEVKEDDAVLVSATLIMAMGAAHRVWCDEQDAVELLVKKGITHGGQRPFVERKRDVARQLRLEHQTAYALAQYQGLGVRLTSNIDQSGELHAHYVEWWGEAIATEIRQDWLTKFAAALEQTTLNITQANTKGMGPCSVCGAEGPAGEPCKNMRDVFDDESEDAMSIPCDGAHV